jgi:hypothetical protein
LIIGTIDFNRHKGQTRSLDGLQPMPASP